jgi:hypothetical protein
MDMDPQQFAARIASNLGNKCENFYGAHMSKQMGG